MVSVSRPGLLAPVRPVLSFMTGLVHCLAQRHSSDSTAMVLLMDVWASLRMSRMASESSNRRHIFGALPDSDKCVASRIPADSAMRSVTQLSRHARRSEEHTPELQQ